MGQIAPPMPALPPTPPVPLSLSCDAHSEAYSRYEAEREFATWLDEQPYTPTLIEELWYWDGQAMHIKEVPGQFVPVHLRVPCHDEWSLLMDVDMVYG